MTVSLIDAATLQQMTGGDSALAADILKIFRENVAPMGRALLDGDVSLERKRVLHTLRGSASSIGANALAEAGNAWEQQDSEANRERFDALLRDTLADIDRILATAKPGAA